MGTNNHANRYNRTPGHTLRRFAGDSPSCFWMRCCGRCVSERQTEACSALSVSAPPFANTCTVSGHLPPPRNQRSGAPSTTFIPEHAPWASYIAREHMRTGLKMPNLHMGLPWWVHFAHQVKTVPRYRHIRGGASVCAQQSFMQTDMNRIGGWGTDNEPFSGCAGNGGLLDFKKLTNRFIDRCMWARNMGHCSRK